MKTLLLLIITMTVMVAGKGHWKETSRIINQLFGTIVPAGSNGDDIQLKQILLPWLIAGGCCVLLLVLLFCSCIIIVKETLLRALLEKKIILMRLDMMKQTEEYNRQIEQHKLQQASLTGEETQYNEKEDDIQRAIEHIVTASKSFGKNPTALEQQDNSSSINNDSQTNLTNTISLTSISDIDDNNHSGSLVSEPSDSLVSEPSGISNLDDNDQRVMSSSGSEALFDSDTATTTTTVKKESHGHIEATVVARSNRRHSSLTSWQPGVNPIGGGATTRKRSLDMKDSPLHTSTTADTIRQRQISKSLTHSEYDSDSLTSVSTASTSSGSLSPSDEGSPVREPIRNEDHHAGRGPS